MPLLDDPSLAVERVDWIQLGQTARLWLSNPSLGSRSPRHSLETTGRVLSIVSDDRSRSQLRRQQLPTAVLGYAYSPETISELLDVGSEQLRSMVADNQVLQVVGAHGEAAFPVFQVTDQHKLLPGLGQLLGELADAVDDPWTWWIWLARPDIAFGGRAPWELLRDGETNKAIQAAGRAAWAWRP
ncbi:hypothetical protein [Leifsonia soli]|uniref:DUF2384 domain-containing protein n=1 Tax=Leifsonia soli TaxID=582665 RepID=A0A852T6I6_9MICO|nr:hypothetical protein [Leifsonia soli]NYD76070.1 hypothetical protein [Leifsonia soli]